MRERHARAAASSIDFRETERLCGRGLADKRDFKGIWLSLLKNLRWLDPPLNPKSSRSEVRLCVGFGAFEESPRPSKKTSQSSHGLRKSGENLAARASWSRLLG